MGFGTCLVHGSPFRSSPAKTRVQRREPDSYRLLLSHPVVKTIAAMRLIGTQAILTRISPQVARMFTEFGVDLGAVPTLAHLQEGIELALEMAGKQITERP